MSSPGTCSAIVGVSGSTGMRSPVIDAKGLIASRHGSTSCTVVLMTSASPDASPVLQSSASKAASLPNSKPSSMPAMIETRVGTSP